MFNQRTGAKAAAIYVNEPALDMSMATPEAIAIATDEALSFASYKFIMERFRKQRNEEIVYGATNALFQKLGYNADLIK